MRMLPPHSMSNLPRAGWDRRGAIMRRALQVAGLLVLVVAVLIDVCVGILFVWAKLQVPA